MLTADLGVKALKLASLVDRLNKIIATIETEY